MSDGRVASTINWPRPEQFNEAIQSLATSMSDEELRGGTAAVNAIGLPMLYSGGFADVYEVHCPATANTWAVKCFTKGASGLRTRYRKISELLDSKSLPFTVGFEYQEEGIRVAGKWYPIVKMQWVEGKTLNEFVGGTLGEPKMLAQLFKLWVKLAARLQREKIAHADLQHGNVILVPKDDQGRLLLKLIDYDGMWIPKLGGQPSGELGHANYQHPQRKAEQIYSADVDRFSHLVICCALRCLHVGGHKLWKPFDNKENLLFVEEDFQNPAESPLFRELWTLRERDAHSLVGHLVLATKSNLNEVPHLHDLVDVESHVGELTRNQESEVRAILKDRASVSMSGATAAATDDPEEEFVLDPGDGSDLVEVAEAVEVVEVAEVIEEPLDSIFGSELPGREETPISSSALQGAVSAGLKVPVPDYHASGWRGLVSRFDQQLATWVGGANTVGHNLARAACILVPTVAVAVPVVFVASLVSGGAESPERFESTAMVDPKPAATTAGSLDSDVIEPASIPEPTQPAAGEGETLINSIGMELRLIEPGEFEIADFYIGESAPRVRIGKQFYIGVHEVTQAQYRAVTGKAPSHFQSDELPVEQVSALEADAFCRMLTEKERSENPLPDGMEYRLPTTAEWEYAARAGDPPGNLDYENQIEPFAWTMRNSGGRTHPVGERQPNRWGLFDMIGNVDEWLLDEYPPPNVPHRCSEADPLLHGFGGGTRLYRGVSWDRGATPLGGHPMATWGHQILHRDATWPTKETGLRVVLAEPPTDLLALRLNEALARNEKESAENLLASIEERRPTDERIPTWRSEVDELPAGLGSVDIVTNSIGMNLIRISAGEFAMGSDNGSSDQQPKHRVKISQDFYFAMHEVTQAEFESVMGKTRIDGWKGPRLPIEVKHEQAVAFCQDLTDREHKEGSLPETLVYRLPTEAEWEYAARAGTISKWFFGDEDRRPTATYYAWNRENASQRSFSARSVGYKIPNPWGLFDVAGNVGEWVVDGYDPRAYQERTSEIVVDPLHEGSEKVVRGGSIADEIDLCSSSARAVTNGGLAGFRVARAVPVSRLGQDPVEMLASELETAINKRDPDTAEVLLARIENTFPSEPRLPLWKKNLANLRMPATRTTRPPRKINPPGRTFPNSLGMQLVQISPGEFDIGSDDGAANEQPVHLVRIARPFFISKHEVTQAQYEAVTGDDPSRFKGDDLPVENVSAEDADQFCRLLTEMEQNAGKLPKGILYRLPTEAEWEYAARAGTTTQWYCGDSEGDLDSIAWYAANSGDKTHPVGQKQPNAWGLYDMAGNVFEWTRDNYVADAYSSRSAGDVIDPLSKEDSNSLRVDRGGSWHRTPRYCRSANRNGHPSILKRSDIGFRVALVDKRGK